MMVRGSAAIILAGALLLAPVPAGAMARTYESAATPILCRGFELHDWTSGSHSCSRLRSLTRRVPPAPYWPYSAAWSAFYSERCRVDGAVAWVHDAPMCATVRWISRHELRPTRSQVRAQMARTVIVGSVPWEPKPSHRPFVLVGGIVTEPDGHGGWISAAIGMSPFTATEIEADPIIGGPVEWDLVFLWHDRSFLGWDTARVHANIRILGGGPGYFTVGYPAYCTPPTSGVPEPPVGCPAVVSQVRIEWSGQGVVVRGRVPRDYDQGEEVATLPG